MLFVFPGTTRTWSWCRRSVTRTWTRRWPRSRVTTRTSSTRTPPSTNSTSMWYVTMMRYVTCARSLGATQRSSSGRPHSVISLSLSSFYWWFIRVTFVVLQNFGRLARARIMWHGCKRARMRAIFVKLIFQNLVFTYFYVLGQGGGLYGVNEVTILFFFLCVNLSSYLCPCPRVKVIKQNLGHRRIVLEIFLLTEILLVLFKLLLKFPFSFHISTFGEGSVL